MTTEKAKEELRYLEDTISLLSSMVSGGEAHSEQSLTMVMESMNILYRRLQQLK